MTRRSRPEQQIQRAVIQAHDRARSRSTFPNGGWRSRVEAAILKAIGTVAGVPDIICIFDLREAGAEVATTVGIDEALAQLEQWRLLRPDVSNQIANAFTELRHDMARRAARIRRHTRAIGRQAI
jgi:hypothetical protein